MSRKIHTPKSKVKDEERLIADRLQSIAARNAASNGHPVDDLTNVELADDLMEKADVCRITEDV